MCLVFVFLMHYELIGLNWGGAAIQTLSQNKSSQTTNRKKQSTRVTNKPMSIGSRWILMRKCPLFSTEKVDFVISFSSSLKLGQACGRLGEGQTSGAVQDEANQYRRVTVDDKTGSSSEKIGTLVRIPQTRSLFLLSTPPTHEWFIIPRPSASVQPHRLML